MLILLVFHSIASLLVISSIFFRQYLYAIVNSSFLILSAVLHDTYAEPESYRLVFEYMNGGDLLDILEEREKSCIDEMNARHICLSLMSAITHLHLHSIAHR